MNQFNLYKVHDVSMNIFGTSYVLVQAWQHAPFDWKCEYHVFLSKPEPKVVSRGFEFSDHPEAQLVNEAVVRAEGLNQATVFLCSLIEQLVDDPEKYMELSAKLNLRQMTSTPMSLVVQRTFERELTVVRDKTQSDELRRKLTIVLGRSLGSDPFGVGSTVQ